MIVKLTTTFFFLRGSNLNIFIYGYAVQAFNFIQFSIWLIFLHVSYYSIAYRINQLTFFLQTNHDSIETQNENGKEDETILAASNQLNEG